MPNQLMRVRLASRGWTGGPGLNTFYFRSSSAVGGDPTLSDAQLAHDRVRDAFAGHPLLYPPSHMLSFLPDVDVIDALTGALVTSFAVNTIADTPGQGLANYGPTPTMILLRLNTNTVLDGARLQGRAFLGPTSAGTDPDGTPDAGIAGQARLIGLGLLDGGAGDFPPLVVWHRPKRDKVTHAITRQGGSGVVISTSVPDKFAILRSRRD